MSVSAQRHRRHVVPLVGAVLALLVMAGCVGQRTPGGYDDSVEENFVSSCRKTSAEDAGGATPKFADGTELDVKEFCECAYDKISKDVPFGDFKDVVNDQIDSPDTLPKSFTKAYQSCPDEDSSTTTEPSSTEPDASTTTGG